MALDLSYDPNWKPDSEPDLSYDPNWKPPKQNTGIVGDIGTALKRGVLQMPGMATGLADIAAAPVSIATGVNRPVSRAADWIGEQTGFQPGKWAEAAAAEYSPEMQQAQQNVEQAKGFFPTIGAVAQNPRVAAQVVAESLPSTIAGGLVARGAMGAVAGAEKLAALRTSAGSADAAIANAARRELLKSGAIAAGIGEGAVTAGQQMAQTGYDVDPALAAGAALGAGVGTGIIGGLSGRIAGSALGRKLGLSDIETSMAAGTLGENAGKAGAAGFAKRIGAGAIQEGLLEEAPQSYQEQVWQNIAAGKPATEGAAEAAALGAVAGGVMGAGVNIASGPLSKAVAAAPGAGVPPTVPVSDGQQTPVPTSGISSAAQFPQFTAPPQPVTGGAPLEQAPTAMPVPQATQNAPAAPGSPSPVSAADPLLPAKQAEAAGAPIQPPQGPLPSANQTEVAIPPAQGPEAAALPASAKPAKGIAAALQYPQQVTEGGGPLAQQAADMPLGRFGDRQKTADISADISPDIPAKKATRIASSSGIAGALVTPQQPTFGGAPLEQSPVAMPIGEYGKRAAPVEQTNRSAAQNKSRKDYYSGVDIGKKSLDRQIKGDKAFNGATFRYSLFAAGGVNHIAIERDLGGWKSGHEYEIQDATGFAINSMSRDGKQISFGQGKYSSRKNIIDKFKTLLDDGWIPHDAYYYETLSTRTGAAERQSIVASRQTPPDVPQQPLSGAGERQPIARLQSAYNEAKAKLDAIGLEPRKPSPERQAFGTKGKAGAPADVVAKYEASVKAYVSWKAKYNRLKKAEVEASNALFAAKKAAPSEQSQYDKNGYDSEGYDSKGYDREGFNRKGFDKFGYDEYGFDKDGVDEGGIGRDDDFYMSDAQIAKANSALGFRRDAGAGGWPIENDYLEKIDTANAYAVADKQGFVYRGLNMPDTQAYIARGSDLVLVSGNNFDDQTDGISFTPFLDIAKDYATRTQTAAVRHPDGAIVKIDMAALRRIQLEEEGDGELAFYDRKELTIPSGKWEVTYNPDAEGPFTLAAKTKPKPRQQSQPAPIMRRDDLVGAIMRVTGGDGIASSMALTIAGDTAGRGLSKLRGLFTNRGTIDLGEVATRLREDEGFDVRDGEHLSELIRAASFGDTAVSMERAERDQDTAEEKRHRDYIRQNAKKLKIKSVAVKFTDLEQRVIAALTRRHERAVELLDERAKKRFDAALEESYALLPEDVVDAVLVDLSGRGLSPREFWNQATETLRYMVADARAQKEQEELNAIEGAEPDWLKDDDGRGNQPAGGGEDANRVAEEAGGEAYSIGEEVIFTPHPERRLDSEVRGILVAKESTGKGRFRLRIRTDRPSPQGDGFVTLQVYSQNGSVQKIGDGLNADRPASFGLAAQTPEEIAAAEAAAKEAKQAEAAAAAAEARKEKAAQDKAEKDRRAAEVLKEREAAKKAEVDKAAEEFALGQAAPEPVVKKVTTEEAKGQKDIFAAPADKPNPDQAAIDKANADFDDALNDLGDIIGKPFRANFTPEQEQKLIPVLTRLMDAAFRKGYYKFKEAARFVLESIVAKFGKDLADQITLDHLQGAYIGMAGRYKDQGADSAKAVVSVEDRKEVEPRATDELPPGWVEAYAGGMATNTDKVSGGIVDTNLKTGKWFFVPENDNIGTMEGFDTRREALDALSMEVEKAAKSTTLKAKGLANVTNERSGSDLERDSQDANIADGMGAQGVPVGAGGNGGAGRPGVAGSGAEGNQPAGGNGLRDGEAAIAGERGNLEVHTGATKLSPGSAGNSVDLGGDSVGVGGLPIEPDAAGRIKEAARGGIQLEVAKAKQRAADKAPFVKGLEAIRQSLPILTEGQQEDVFKTETRFAVPDGYGMLFTNGTGTGKTFSALGVIKRFAAQGKQNILVVAPSQEIISAWQKAGKLLGLDLSLLEDINDAGSGMVITTYANMGANNELANRDWDLIVHDEAHYLSMNKDGTNTESLNALRAISLHPDGAFKRAIMLHGDIRDAASIAQKQADIAARSDDARDWPMAKVHQARANKLNAEFNAKHDAIKADVAARQLAKRPRVMFLSATPFAYEKSVDWANGYLFDYNEGRGDERNEFRGYNAGSNSDQFMMQHFGYRMRYGKLTAPDAKVDSGLMQRQFNSWLKKSGSLSGRMLDVDADYDRRFILVDSAIGQRIDEALQWFDAQRKATNDKDRQAAISAVQEFISEKFDYLSRRYLLESIKAKEVVPHVREHLAMGRKVVVFHDYKKGGGFNPFIIGERTVKDQDSKEAATSAAEWNGVVGAFNAEFKDIINSDLFKQTSPILMFKNEFPGVLLFNGDVSVKDRRANVQRFQDDDSGPQVILVQSAAGKEGISLHDTTGKHQRVLFNLGQPTQPTTAIQQEGRIYRTGQVTDAIFRYLNTGTNWEKWAFATTIANRASAAENLGMGELARSLKDAFIAGFEESDNYRAGMDGEGKGGKERDKAANNALTEYDRARAFYFGTQKKNGRTKAQEGADYFATPEPVGLKMVEWANVRPGEKVLEPSAGHGAIARWMPATAERTAVEPSMTLRPRLAMVFDGQIIDSDFESLNVVNKYDAIVMNPPFGSGGKTAIDHLAKAATHLRDGGRIVALLPTGPAADKKFEKWFYEEQERPVKPLFKSPVGDVRKGDTVTVYDEWAQGDRKFVVGSYEAKNDIFFDVGRTIGFGSNQIKGIERTGKQTENYNSAAGLNLVADIKMPPVTFERAGTAVSTRIVVIEKSANSPQQTNRDFSDAADINTLFDRLENMALPDRAKEPEPEAAAAPAKKEKAPPAKVGDSVTVNGNQYAIEIYTTNDGKDKRGIWMEEKEAKAINPRAFKSSKMRGTPAEGKFFVDEYWLNKRAPESSSRFSFAGQQSATAMAAVGASPADAAVFDMASEGRSAQEILSFLSKASRRPFNRVLAAALSRIGVSSTVSVDPAAGWRNNQGRNGAKFAASYSPKTDTVALYTPREAERHILHEFVHAASLKAIARGGPAARQMQSIFDYVQRTGTMSDQYGMGNFSRFPNETDAQFKKRALDEFTAELFTNPQFQVRLKQLPAPSGSKLRSAWDWIVRVIANLLGLKTKAQETALDRALSVGAALLQENASLTMPKGETALYHTTWHGSPHKFYTFDLSKIGTGEGAQAYGHGLYVAEAPGVAEGYAGMRPAAGVSILNGKEWQAETYAQMVGEARARGAGSYEKGIASLEKDFQKAVDAREASVADDFQNAIDALRSMQKSGVDLNTGQNFYKVDLPAEAVARMLDWDAALSNQPPEVQSALKDAGIADVDKWTDAGLKGRELYNRAKRGAPAKLPLNQSDDQSFASARLKQAGISGIRYLDQQSRSGEKDTSNFVLFDDKLARIIEVNGVETGVQPWQPGEWEATQSGERFSQEQPFSGREVAATPEDPDIRYSLGQADLRAAGQVRRPAPLPGPHPGDRRDDHRLERCLPRRRAVPQAPGAPDAGIPEVRAAAAAGRHEGPRRRHGGA
jgi:hypothetical protein